jgi:hypothetical protein
MKNIIFSILLFVSSGLISSEYSPEGKSWELVVFAVDPATKIESTLVFYFSDYSSMKTKMDFIARTHRPKGSIKRLFYREIKDTDKRFHVVFVSR